MTLQYSTTEVIAAGTDLTVNYEIPFSFAWLDENDVKVYRTDTNTPVPDAQWQFKTRQSIEIIASNFAENETYIVRRETQVDEPTITFAPGSAIRAEDLNQNQLQVLYQGQELGERSVGSQGVTFTGNVIVPATTASTPSNAAATKAYVDATQTHNDSQLATIKSTCETAETNAVSAKNAAETAETNAESAQSAAEAARDVAQKFATNPEDTQFTYNTVDYNSALHYAAKAQASATAAAGTVEKAVFFGFKRDSTGNNLHVEFNTGGDTTTYSPADYTYKGVQHWFIGNNGLMNLSGPNINTPKFSFVNGHLLFELSA